METEESDLVMVVDVCHKGADEYTGFGGAYFALARTKDNGPVNAAGFRLVRSYELGEIHDHHSDRIPHFVRNIGDLCMRLDNREIGEEDLPDSLYN